jgi:hypothetical protein
MAEADEKIKIPPVYRKNLIISSAICHQTWTGVQAGSEQHRVRQKRQLNRRQTGRNGYHRKRVYSTE